MRCLDCGIEAIERTGDINLNIKTIGDFTVSNVTYLECPECGEQFFSPETLDVIEKKEREIKEYLIGQYPISDFIGADAAAEILGVTRQALNKNKRIKRGFIYSRRFDGKIAYLKKSVELFNEIGDGRFELKDRNDKYIMLKDVQPGSSFQNYFSETTPPTKIKSVEDYTELNYMYQ